MTRPPEQAPSVRLSMNLTARTADTLDDMQTRLGLSSRTEAVTKAINLTGRLTEQMARGSEILVRDPDGTLTLILLV